MEVWMQTSVPAVSLLGAFKSQLGDVIFNCIVKCQPNFNLRFLTSDHSMALVRFNWSVFARKMRSTSEFAKMFLSKCVCVICVCVLFFLCVCCLFCVCVVFVCVVCVCCFWHAADTAHLEGCQF